MSQAIIVEVEDGIMTITINRPEAKNAVDKAVAEGISAALDQLDTDDSVKVAILTGAAGGFSSGMDLKAYLRGELPVVEGRGFAGITEATIKKPLIAAVEGFALAGGFEVMLCCDLIVAADNAKLGIPEVTRGLAAAGGGLLKMPRQMPHRLAMELALTGDPISAQRALDIGLINQVSAPGEALAAAKVLAKRITQNGPLAVVLSKQVINKASDWSSDEMTAEQFKVLAPIFSSEDSKEGARAFAEKRKPVWTGK
jgi:enoyl-CoA hydratase